MACEYCDVKNIYESSEYYFAKDFDGNTCTTVNICRFMNDDKPYLLFVGYDDVTFFEDEYRINYCPMCGEKLDKNV